MIGKTFVRDLLKAPVDRLDAEVLLAHVLKKDRSWVKAHGTDGVSASNARRFQQLVARRVKHEPVAYLTGTKDFFGRAFAVNKWTLIPRPETELLVEQALEANGDVYWDIGTGSGAIAVSVACARRVPVLATDISSRALLTAKRNARTHGATIAFIKSNLLQPAAYRWLKKHAATHLVITANLPYLPVSDKKTLAKDVTAYEPSSALFSGTDGLTLIKRFLGQLARHAPEWRYTHVTALLEFDPPQARALLALAQKTFPANRVTIHRDLAARARLLELRLHNLRTK